jgi:MFS transporter, ACDE family, multidrug resistance protein
MSARSATPTAPTNRPPLLVVFSITVSGILGNTLINAPLPDILAAFGRGAGDAGLVVSAATLPGIFVAPAIGIMADRFGRRKVLLPCLVLFGIAGLGAGFAPTFGLLVALRFAQGIGAAGLINLAVVLIADNWDGTDRARLIGWNSAVLTVSIAVLPPIGGLLAEIGGWRWAFAPFGLALASAVVVYRSVPESGTREVSTVRAQVRAAAAVVRKPVVGGSILFGTAFFVLAFGLMLTALPLMLEQRFGLSVGLRGLVFIAPALGATLVAFNMGRLRVRFGARRLLVAGAAVFAVGYLLMGWVGALGVVVLGAFVHGLGEGATVPTVQELVVGSSPNESRGAVMAAWVGAARVGQTAGPLLAGLAMASVGATTTFTVGIAGALLLAVITWVAGARAAGGGQPAAPGALGGGPSLGTAG